MATQITELTVFLASPSDVTEEAVAVESVIQEVNRLLESMNLRFTLVSWKSHSVPGFGEDAQDVINQNIGDDYDLFVGLMWKKFGTKTGRADSGTEEEFNRAYAKFKQDKSSVQILFYFKTATPADLNQINPVELEKVNKFKTSLGAKGGLYWEFKDKEELSKYLRMHLMSKANAFGANSESNHHAAKPPTTTKKKREKENTATGEKGLLDYVAQTQDDSVRLEALLGDLTNATRKLSEMMSTQTSEILACKLPSGQLDLKRAIRSTRTVAAELDQYSGKISRITPKVSKLLDSSITSIIHTLRLQKTHLDSKTLAAELGPAEVATSALYAAMEQNMQNMVTFRSVIASLGDYEAKLNKAKRNAVEALDGLLIVLGKGTDLVGEAHKLIKQSQHS